MGSLICRLFSYPELISMQAAAPVYPVMCLLRRSINVRVAAPTPVMRKRWRPSLKMYRQCFPRPVKVRPAGLIVPAQCRPLSAYRVSRTFMRLEPQFACGMLCWSLRPLVLPSSPIGPQSPRMRTYRLTPGRDGEECVRLSCDGYTKFARSFRTYPRPRLGTVQRIGAAVHLPAMTSLPYVRVIQPFLQGWTRSISVRQSVEGLGIETIGRNKKRITWPS